MIRPSARPAASRYGATRIDVQAVLYSDFHSPDEISARLGLQPTRTASKGIRVGRRLGHRSYLPHNMWCLSSESNVEGSRFADHMDWMLSKLNPVQDRVAGLLNSGSNVTFRMTCVVWTSGTGVALALAARHSEALARLKPEFWFSFADYGEEP